MSCGQCQQWMHTDDWQIKLAGEPKRPVPRRGPPPCRVCPKIPRDKKPCPENATEPGPGHWTLLHHYLQVRAGAAMPDSAFFRQCCGLLYQREKQVDQDRLAERISLAMRRPSP